MSDISLTDEQNKAIDYVQKNIKTQQIISIGGFAGTGKSTCLKFLSDKFKNYAVCAFTGKACNVLRKKGITKAETIHSTIYDCKLEHKNKPIFDLKKKYSLGIDGFLVDEASMISEEIFENLLYFGFPVVFIGDHGQLEPVGTSFNIMNKPDITLETIHRNANTVARFADFLRKGNSAISYKQGDKSVLVKQKNKITIDELVESDQIICAYNRTRLQVNSTVRKHLGYTKPIHAGEKIICLKNNKNLDIFNGMQATVDSVSGKKIKFKNDRGKKYELIIDTKQFGNPQLLDDAHSNNEVGYFDYGYAITCHKAQGDEWEKVLVLEEKCDLWEHKRWTYTAASRSKESLIWGSA